MYGSIILDVYRNRQYLLTDPNRNTRGCILSEPDPTTNEAVVPPVPVVRCGLGGVLMGLANLVPGISGGTMLVACGIYTLFIDAVSDATRLKFNKRMILVLGCVVIGAVAAIGGLASVIHWALVNHRWVMFSLFIGLTLGGVPILWVMAKPIKRDTWLGVLIGAIIMGALVLVQELGGSGAGMSGPFGLIVGGAAAASAMILPGVSGAFLLLLLGQYEPIIGAIKGCVGALKDGDIGGVMSHMGVVIPVGIGVLVGVAVVSNALRWVLHHHERVTLGVLLGLIMAAPAGLYPFREGVVPQVGDTLKGELVTEENLAEMQSSDNAKDWEQKAFTPSMPQVVGAHMLIIGGFVVTVGIARVGREKKPD
jgi:putative membrane protein